MDAFIALGGSADKTGNVSADKLRTIIKDFGLTIDIDRLIREVSPGTASFCPALIWPSDRCLLCDRALTRAMRVVRPAQVDTDHSGLIDYQEFAVMMKS